LGLFCGASFLSFIEFVIWLAKVVPALAKSGRKK
jgi:hypothetical protein